MPRSPRSALVALAALTGLAVAAPTIDARPTAPPIVESFAPSLVTVTADREGRNALVDAGLDVTEHAGHDYVEVVLHTPAELDLLRSLGFPFEVRIADLAARRAEIAEIDAAYAAANVTSPLPSGRTAYRTLVDYEFDLTELAKRNPGLVRKLTLPNRTHQGRTVKAIEIAADVDGDDGRPTMAIMGLHHAREWPSGEHTMEFAFDLVQRFQAGDPEIQDLLGRVRVVVIPVVNPDGFHASITDGAVVDLRSTDAVFAPVVGSGLVPTLITPLDAYKRKNCSTYGAPAAEACGNASSPGGYGLGVDLNRNYSAFHAGPGTDPDNPLSPVYPGPSGISEPESKNVQDLVGSRHVTMLITNHTFGNLLLRPNGVHPETIGPDGLPIGDSPDEHTMAEIGERIVANNGYSNQHGWELYDTTGTTEDYSYNATGGFGYTFEIGGHEFHPPFPEVVGEYLGTEEHAGKGNREAFLVALREAANTDHHGVLVGTVAPGATLELTRTGGIPTWDGAVLDTVTTRYRVGSDGAVRWHVNPSTRPIAEARTYQEVGEEPAATATFQEAAPALNEAVDVSWTVEETIPRSVSTLSWDTTDDMDFELHRVEDGELVLVESSGNFLGDEQIVVDDLEAGDYVFRVINYASIATEFTIVADSFDRRTVVVPGDIEVWTLNCHLGGELVSQQELFIDRGDVVELPADLCAQD